MAAFASDMVGLGIVAGKTVDVMIDLQIKTAAAQAYSYEHLFRPGPTVTEMQRRTNVTDLDNMLIAGNKAVFRDIYWQHLVYQQKGLSDLLAMLSTLPGPGSTTLIEAWQEVDAGVKMSNLACVWRGNELLLRYEQERTLQPVYDRYRAVADALSYALVSPLPGQLAPFQMQFPGGSVRNFANRWAWITKNLVTEWKRLDTSSIPAKMRMLAMGMASKPMICLFD